MAVLDSYETDDNEAHDDFLDVHEDLLIEFKYVLFFVFKLEGFHEVKIGCPKSYHYHEGNET